MTSPAHHPAPAPAPVPVPAPASAGFASIFGQPSPTSELEALAFSTPAMPARVEEPPPEEIDLLGLPKPRTRTTNDILKLYEKKEEKAKDLLAGDVFDSDFLVDIDQQAQTTTILPQPVASEASTYAAMAPSSSTSLLQQELHQDLQPQMQQQQQELQQEMPLETVQPEEIVEYQPVDGAANVAAPETAAQAYYSQYPAPTLVYSEIKSPVQSEPIAIPARDGAVVFGQNEDFDAFSSRFESVGKEDTLMVENDPFDPFSAGGSTKGNSGK